MRAAEETITTARYARDSLQQEITDDLPANIAGLEAAKEVGHLGVRKPV